VFLTGVEFGERHRAQTGLAGQGALGWRPRWTDGQTGTLCGVSAPKRPWETRFVIPGEGQRVPVDSGAQEHGPPVVFGVDHEPHAEGTLALHVREDRRIPPDRGIVSLNFFQA
jgi:hypothetical protein